MNKTTLLHKIKNLQGLSDDEKAELIGLLNNTKKYGLVWEDKPGGLGSRSPIISPLNVAPPVHCSTDRNS